MSELRYNKGLRDTIIFGELAKQGYQPADDDK